MNRFTYSRIILCIRAWKLPKNWSTYEGGWLVGKFKTRRNTYPTLFLPQFWLEFSNPAASVSDASQKTIQSQLGDF